MKSKSLIITSIANDKHPILNRISKECLQQNIPFIVIGDTKSPLDFKLEGCDFWSIEKQQKLPFKLAKITPTLHYSRKNLGYLIAIKNGANELLETDDDNIPRKEFWEPKERVVKSYEFKNTGWVNVYQYFTKQFIWPRGLPLEELQKKQIELNTLRQELLYCPIQQGLADENPDVDAVYRLTYPLPINFEKKVRIALGKNAWSPFNSQNTYWFKEVFPLMYLPSYCSFRMTDIWRSFVAQRILWECGWSVLFHESTVWQERNDHNLMKDFEDEIPGYLNNYKIAITLERLELMGGVENIYSNLFTCYTALINMGVIGEHEIPLLEAWIADCKSLMSHGN